MKNQTFNEFCHQKLDGLYNPRFSDDKQCTGYIELKKMVINNINPASIKEIERWENNPTKEELSSIPDIKYLRFLHPILRPYIINHWENIKQLSI